MLNRCCNDCKAACREKRFLPVSAHSLVRRSPLKITVDRNVVEFSPENAQETADLEVLWRVVVDCVNESKKMEPIGEYIPVKSNVARFVIENIPGGKTHYSADTASDECTVVCTICNKYAHLKKGDAVPNCCGREMENID